MGTGKILMQAFLQFRNLKYIYGVELSVGRYRIAEEAALRMVHLLGVENYQIQMNPGKFIIITEAVQVSTMKGTNTYETEETTNNNDNNNNNNSSSSSSSPNGNATTAGENSPNNNNNDYVERVLHLQCGNIFDITNIDIADIVMMETDFPFDLFPQLNKLFSGMKDQARMLSYIDLRRIWEPNQFTFRQLEVNRHLSDRYPTSWSVQRGHHFYLWAKV
jgi:hypothetical protein